LSFFDLADSTPGEFDKVVGLTEKDISTAKNGVDNWGIMGLGYLDGRPCVVSTFRLNLHKDASSVLVMARLVKVVNHELGHTLGLDHCPNAGCLMEDAKGTIKTVDNEPGGFCPSCLEKLEDVVRK
jgi:archaemetzincin